MSKLTISALLSVGVGVVIVAGVHVSNRFDEGARSRESLAGELSALREDLRTDRDEVRDLAARLQRLESTQEELASNFSSKAAIAVPAVATGDATEEGAVSVTPAHFANPEVLKEFVFAAIEEERQLRDEERQQQREEMRKRAEERRQEIAKLSEGPFDRFNLKVNSLANVLGMDENQKQAYFELSKASSDKFRQTMEKLREERRAQEANSTEEGNRERGRGRGRGRGEDRGRFMELYEPIQKEFAAAVGEILTPGQLETYNNLSRSAQSFQSQSYVSADPEGESRFGRFPGGFGNFGDSGGFRGRRQGGGGGRGR